MKKLLSYPARFTSAIIISFFTIFFSAAISEAQVAPSTYTAITDTNVRPMPPAPALGPANSVIKDPTFGSRILRVTDPNTKSGQSFISSDSGFLRAWNANSTAIKLTGPHGDGYWLEFNPNTFNVGDGSSRPAPMRCLLVRLGNGPLWIRTSSTTSTAARSPSTTSPPAPAPILEVLRRAMPWDIWLWLLDSITGSAPRPVPASRIAAIRFSA